MPLRVLDVCAAVVRRQRRFLLATRPAGKHLAEHWEFPGGKVQAGETWDACILRELHEELGIRAHAPRWLTTVEHDYPELRIRLHFLACELPAGEEPHPHEGQQFGWFAAAELAALRLAPADRRFADQLAAGVYIGAESADPSPLGP